MNEKQLRELIRIVVGTGTMLGFLGMLTRGKNASPKEDADVRRITPAAA